MPGHAGNFLTRLFSLSPETLPQVPTSILKTSIGPEPSLPLINRLALYSFKEVPACYSDWQLFHRDWPDYHQQQLFHYFNDWYNPPFSHVVYSIHPHEFKFFEDEILKDNYEFYYVDLDDKFSSWVTESQQKLGFKYRPTYEKELADLDHIKTKYNMTKISLSDMLTSDESFVDEYLRITSLMKITPDIDSAVLLYQDWFSVRGPNA